MTKLKRALITGISGFVGSHLADFLLEKEIEVFGTIRWRSQLQNITHLKDRITLIEADINDSFSLIKLLKEAEPDYIFHLAAQSFVPTSWSAPAETLETNIIGTVNLLEAVRVSECEARIQIAGSSEEYGYVLPEELPITESNPLRPMSPYGVSKVAADLLGFQYNRSYGLKIVRTRAFNHTGPRRGEPFVCSNFAKQIADIENGLKKPVLYVGNLKAQRDFTDVRDVVRAYWLSLNKCEWGEVYNICSGEVVEIQKVLDILLTNSSAKITIEKDRDRLRPSDVPILKGDNAKFKTQTGWKPEISFERTLQDLLNFWREQQ
jgi:GDP-4-dehydro-6-deoxy-D-mannose reductase